MELYLYCAGKAQPVRTEQERLAFNQRERLGGFSWPWIWYKLKEWHISKWFNKICAKLILKSAQIKEGHCIARDCIDLAILSARQSIQPFLGELWQTRYPEHKTSCDGGEHLGSGNGRGRWSEEWGSCIFRKGQGFERWGSRIQREEGEEKWLGEPAGDLDLIL